MCGGGVLVLAGSLPFSLAASAECGRRVELTSLVVGCTQPVTSDTYIHYEDHFPPALLPVLQCTHTEHCV